jgi:MtN3 and saliva related transmembrane protein
VPQENEGCITFKITSQQIALIGFSAGVLTTASFIPQAVKAWRSKDLEGLSAWMYVLISAGVALWFVYGIFLGSTPIIVFNAATLLLSLSILVAKLIRGS